MKFIDFFSGIGGFTRGMELAGHKCVGHCEFDKFAEASYRSMHTITEPQREYLLTLPLKQRQMITPERANKRQNGRRFKENGEPSFTCYQGVVTTNNINAIWSDKYQCYLAIRKLTPRECFRLQGWEDKYFERAEQFNSNSQLYKQAGNGVTVTVIKHIAKRMKT